MIFDRLIAALGISSDMISAIIAAIVPFIIVMTAIWSIMSALRNARVAAQERMLKDLVSEARKKGRPRQNHSVLIDGEEDDGERRVLLDFAEKLLKLVNFDKEKTKTSLEKAGERDPKALQRYMIQRSAGMLIGPMIAWATLPGLGFEGVLLAALAIGAALAGGILVDVLLDKKVAARQARLEAEFPVVLDLLKIHLEAGTAFDVALSRAARELRSSFPTAAEEMLALRSELELYSSRDTAFERFVDRVGSKAAKSFAAIVRQSEKRGNAIAPALRRLARDATAESLSEIEKKAQKIPTLMQLPMVMFILPSIFAAVIGPVVVQVILMMKE